jgi:hypothetical protein
MDKLLWLLFCYLNFLLDAADLDSLLVPPQLATTYQPPNFDREAAETVIAIDHSELPLWSKDYLKECIRLVKYGYQPLAGETFEESVKRIYKLRLSQGYDDIRAAILGVNQQYQLIQYVIEINKLCGSRFSSLQHYTRPHKAFSGAQTSFDTDSTNTEDNIWCACCNWLWKSKL